MTRTFRIMIEELKYWSVSIKFYITIALFLFSVGLYTWFFNESSEVFDFNIIVNYHIQICYWGIAIWVSLFAAGVIIEERNSGTIGLLVENKVKIHEIVLGKLASISIVLFCVMLLSLINYAFIINLKIIEHLDYILLSYLFIFMLGIAYSTISVAVSCYFSSLKKSFLIRILIIIFLHFIANFLGDLSTEGVKVFFNYIGMSGHISYLMEYGFKLSIFIYILTIIVFSTFIIIYKLKLDRAWVK